MKYTRITSTEQNKNSLQAFIFKRKGDRHISQSPLVFILLKAALWGLQEVVLP